MLAALTWPPIHNIIVVTSPIGDHAPPALAARIKTPANNHNVSLSLISFGRRAAITIAVVRLSKTAEKKNVITLKIQIKYTFLFVVILSVIIEKPWWASTNSTIVIAPSKKKRISAISTMWCWISWVRVWWSIPENAKSPHPNPPIIKADAALSTFIGCSNAIAA